MDFSHNIDLLKRVENMTVVFRLVTVELADWIVVNAAFKDYFHVLILNLKT